MLKNKKLVKIAVCMLLSVTLVCASFLEVFAEDVANFVPYTDTENNMYYHAEITASVDKNDGIVYAVQASTLVAKNIEQFSATYGNLFIVTIIRVSDEGEEIYCLREETSLDLAVAGAGAEARTEWIVPNMMNPFDYVTTLHIVYDLDNVEYDVAGNPYNPVIWSYRGVYGYNDFLLFS